MMKVVFSFGILFSVFSFLLFTAHSAQTAESQDAKILDLRKQIEELTKQAEKYRQTIGQKQKEGNTLQRQIDIITAQIGRLQTQISLTAKQIDSAKIEIEDLEGRIFDAQKRISKQKATIGRLVVTIYERDRHDLVAMLLQSNSLSEFTNQAEQVSSVTTSLITSLEEIRTEKQKLEENQESLEYKKTTLETLNKQHVEQKFSLDDTKKDKDSLLTKTRGQEKAYAQLLQEVERKKSEFFSQLKDLEAQALKNGSFIVHVTADRIPPRGTKIFKWPEEDYHLTQGYGYTTYAKRGAYGGAAHNGIDLASGTGTPIHPVMAGTILASGFNKGFGNFVAVRHEGNLVSVYAHMRAQSGLSNGTGVNTDSVIGYEGSTGNSTGSHLHLSVYSDFFTYLKDGQLYFNYFDGSLNPLDYLP